MSEPREVFDVMPDIHEAMHLLTEPIEHEIVIQKSRFIAYLAPVTTVDEADDIIRTRRALHPSARHACTALALGTPLSLQRSNDDGEPGGTAGMPMAQALRGRHMTNVIAVATRYLGGVKLGAGGLVRAYSSAVTDALDAAGARGILRERLVRELSVMRVGYAMAGSFEAGLRAWADGSPAGVGLHSFDVDSVEFGNADVEITVAHEPGAQETLAVVAAELSSGAVRPRTAGWVYRDVPLS